MKSSYDIITIIGPTASGKTEFAAALAANIDAEIISADSRQVYRRMDLGTGKDLADYTVNGYNVPYHLIDIVEPPAIASLVIIAGGESVSPLNTYFIASSCSSTSSTT